MVWPNRPSTFFSLLLLPMLVVGCSSEPAGTTDVATDTSGTLSPSVEAAYVLLVETPRGATAAMARILVDPGTPCPTLTASPGGAPAVSTHRRDNLHGFAIDVCESPYPFGEALTVTGTSIDLPAVTLAPQRVAVLGDTGCKVKDQDGCTGTDPSEWPLPAIAAAASAQLPDLVLHMGDYNYRGTSAKFRGSVGGHPVEGQWNYDAGDGSPPSDRCEINGPYYSQNQTGSDDPDSWQAWKLDFFEPARPLLAAAPWVFARGNHELCSRAGPGWLYFLGPSSNLPAGGGTQIACPPQDGGGAAGPHIRFVEPYTVQLGDLAVSVVDNANACDELANFADIYGTQLASLAADTTEASTHWLIMHRPIFGVDGDASEPPYACDGSRGTGPVQPYSAINRTLQCALTAPGASTLLPKIDLLFAGHMHRFEWLEFASDSQRPPSLVVGNSGVELSDSSPHGPFAPQIVDGEQASGFAIEQYGYVEMVRGSSGWNGQVVALDPSAWSDVLPDCGAGDSAATGATSLCVRGMPTS